MPDASPRCRACGTTVAPANRFCPGCGELYPAKPTADVEANGLREIAAEVASLVREKALLGAELERLATESGERELSAEERSRWEHTYTRWRDVASEITLLVDRVHPRAESDRRRQEAARPDGEERRSQDDRRDPFWTRTP